MTKFDQRLPYGDDGVMRRLQDLEREVRELRAGRRLEASTIGRGGITVQGGAIILKDAEGNEIARLGIRDDIPAEPDGDPQPGFILRRNDGSLAFSLDDPNPVESGYRQILKMQDAQGHIIFSEDANSGWGMATPTFGYPVYPIWDTPLWPVSLTTTAWVGAWTNYIPLWNPILEISVMAFSTTSAGEVRILLNGQVVGAAQNVPASSNTAQLSWSINLSSLAVPGIYPSAVAQLVIEHRNLTSGGTAIKCCPVWIYGRGSDPIV